MVGHFGDFPLEDFKRTGVIGKGSCGEVAIYEKNDHLSIRRYAVKTCYAKHKGKEYWKKELKTLHIQHDNIAKLKGWCIRKESSGSVVHIVLKLYKCDLTKFQQEHINQQFTILELMSLCPQLTSGLECLHSQNIAHRDLKPSNILVDYKKNPHENIKGVNLVLTDFGLSRHVGDEASTSEFSVVGNRKYASPEVTQMKNEWTENAKYDPMISDVFSLGAIFFYMHKGRVPFQWDQLLLKDFKEEKSKMLADEIQHEGFLQLLQAMMEWSPNTRPDMKLIKLLPFIQESSKIQTMTAITNFQPFPKRQALNARASNHTMIVLIGPTGVGKTSTLLHLLGKQEDRKLQKEFSVSERSSGNRSTTEICLGMKGDQEDLKHISLSIVDTPGLNDTMGSDQDARNMASIETFLNNNTWLKQGGGLRRYPNLVLLAIRGDDNRFNDNHSVFAKCLSQLLCDDLHLTDGTNLVIVLTQAWKICYEKRLFGKTIREKIKDIKAFVKKHRGWDVPVTFIENDPPPAMPRIGCWTQFPDGTLQPKNLFDCIMNEVLLPKGDLIGRDTIKEFFKEGAKPKYKTAILDKIDATLKRKKRKRSDLEEKYYKYLEDFDYPSSSEEEVSDQDSGMEDEGQAVNDDKCETLSDNDRKQFQECKTTLSDSEPLTKDVPSTKSIVVDETLPKEYYNLVRRMLEGYNTQSRCFTGKKVQNGHVQITQDHAELTTTCPKQPLQTDTLELILTKGTLETRTPAEPEVENDYKLMIRKLNIPYHRKVKFVRSRFEKFFERYGQGMVVSAEIGGGIKLGFDRNLLSPVKDPEHGYNAFPNQLRLVLHNQLGDPKLPCGLQMFYRNQAFTKVGDDGDDLILDFEGGDEAFQTKDNLKKWMKSVDEEPTLIVRDDDIILHHDYIRKLNWLPQHELIAHNVQSAFEDMFGDGREQVAEKQEKENITEARRIRIAVEEKTLKDPEERIPGFWATVKKFLEGK